MIHECGTLKTCRQRPLSRLVWVKVQNYNLQLDVVDSSWRWTDNGTFTTRLAWPSLRARFISVWRIWFGILKLNLKVFAWLAMLGKRLTADNLQKRGWSGGWFGKNETIASSTAQRRPLSKCFCYFWMHYASSACSSTAGTCMTLATPVACCLFVRVRVRVCMPMLGKSSWV